MKRWMFLACSTLFLALACGRTNGFSGSKVVEVPDDQKYDPSKDTPVHVTERPIPDPPADCLIQLCSKATYECDRVMANGSWIHRSADGIEHPHQVQPKGEAKRNRMSSDGIDAVKLAVGQVDWLKLPAKIPDVASGDPKAPRELYTFSVLHDSNTVTVQVNVVSTDPVTFGPLQSLWQTINDNAWSVGREKLL